MIILLIYDCSMFVKSNIIAQFVYGTLEGMFQLKRIRIESTGLLEALFSRGRTLEQEINTLLNQWTGARNSLPQCVGN